MISSVAILVQCHVICALHLAVKFTDSKFCSCVAQEDNKMLKTLFAQIGDEELDDSRRRDLVLFLKEFCAFSQTLQQDSKNQFFKVSKFIKCGRCL